MSSFGKSCDLCGGEQRKAECNNSCEMYLQVGHDAPLGVSVTKLGRNNQVEFFPHKLIESPTGNDLMYQICCT